MIAPGLLHEPLAAAEVVNRRQPPRSLVSLTFDRLRQIRDGLLEVADAMLAPEHELEERR